MSWKLEKRFGKSVGKASASEGAAIQAREADVAGATVMQRNVEGGFRSRAQSQIILPNRF